MKKLLLSLITLLLPISAEMLEIGKPAPLFTLKSADGNEISLASYKNKKMVVLVFYPGDNTPICTKQLCELRDSYEKLRAIDVEVLGINAGDSASHERFASKNGYQFPLLVDEDKIVAKEYGQTVAIWGVKRAVFVVDKNGKIIFSQQGKPPVEDIISAIEKLK
jgi:peroxiredoxin Q/BCP